ncbi:CBO0543 family protein [Bacillus sp. PS06]|uniref:CBO0543 family protein n=1 Tax=Bacillus sp. PS06 TaxID=2764176 RepID=UPI00399066DD
MPSWFRNKSKAFWIPFYLLNCIFNYLSDKILVEKKAIEYPVRFLPKVFKVNFIYNFLVCPFITFRFCLSTNPASLKDIILKLLIFSLPQGLYEIILEKKTNTIKFKGNWKGYYSLALVFAFKIMSLGVYIILKNMMSKREASSR